MYLNNDTFDIEVYCKMCDSDNVELCYDYDNSCINIKCNSCGNTDILYLHGGDS